jgi:hypothetical protein
LRCHSYSKPLNHLRRQILWQLWVSPPSLPNNAVTSYTQPLEHDHLCVTQSSFHFIRHHAPASVNAWLLKTKALGNVTLRTLVKKHQCICRLCLELTSVHTHHRIGETCRLQLQATLVRIHQRSAAVASDLRFNQSRRFPCLKTEAEPGSETP